MAPVSSLALAFEAPRAPTLRPYQTASIDAVLARFSAGDRATLLVLPTGCGKTVVFAQLARITTMRGRRVLVLAHRTELLVQAREKLHAIGCDAAIEQGPARAGRAEVVVASVQTLRGPRLQSWAPTAFDLIVIDEAHHATASTYRAIVDHFASARVLGVTATPDRADGQGLGPIFESIAYNYALPDAIRDGFLAPIRARRIKLDVDLDKVKTRAGDLDQQGLSSAMTDPYVLEATSRALVEEVGDRPTVLFSVDVAHAHLLAEACNQLKPGCARAVSGESTAEERAAAAADLASGKVQIVANAALWTEGFDCPVIAAVAIARPTKSRGLFTQMVGRGTRLSPATGKTDCLVLDFAGLTSRHRLVSSVDVLAGVDLPEGLAELVVERSEGEPIDIAQAIAEAREQIARARVAPTYRWITHEVGGLLGADLGDVQPLLAAGFALATEPQLQQLRDKGFAPPDGLTDLAATRVLDVLRDRQRRNLATYKQVRFLVRLGMAPADAGKLDFRAASDAIDKLAAHKAATRKYAAR